MRPAPLEGGSQGAGSRGGWGGGLRLDRAAGEGGSCRKAGDTVGPVEGGTGGTAEARAQPGARLGMGATREVTGRPACALRVPDNVPSLLLALPDCALPPSVTGQPVP